MMVLHELAINAAEHGALKSRGGTLKVAWHQEDDPQKVKVLYFEWDESVAPLGTTSAKGVAGYGTALIDSTIASLRGGIERNNCEGGFSVRFWVPLS
jgi:two-component sensor histidine kinase